MKRTLLLLSFVFLIAPDIGANLKWVRAWAGVSQTSFVYTTDPSGNVYTTGSFSGTIDFDPGPGVFNTTATTSEDMFICKLDSVGNFLWVKTIGGPPGPTGICVDALGGVCITGTFSLTVDFDPGPGVFNLSGPTLSNTFILKVNTAGAFIWAKAISAPNVSTVVFSSGLTLDASNNIYITGSFSGVIDFDPGPGIFNVSSKKAWTGDVFVSRFDPSGNLVWVKTFGGVDDDIARVIKLDPLGNIYTLGFIKDSTVDFDPGPGTFNITPNSQNIFVSKLDPSGNFKWAKTFDLIDFNADIALDAFSNVYVSGGFNGVKDFDPGTGVYNLTASTYIGWASFVSKLDSTGAFVWATKPAQANSFGDVAYSIETDAANNVYVTGLVDQNIGGANTIYNIKMDQAGAHLWEKDFSGYTWNNSDLDIQLDKSGNVYTKAFFQGTIDFDPGPNVHNITVSVNVYNVFLTKISSCSQLTVELVNSKDVSCYGAADGSAEVLASEATQVTYEWLPEGGTSPVATGLNAGMHTCIVTNTCGDTVMVNVNITQPPAINTFVGFSGANMTSNQNGAGYQWINCNGFQPISGATAQSFTAPSPGSYAVIVTVDSCSDTSGCINITAAGIDNPSNYNPVAIYPNPNNGSFTIELKMNTQMIITDALGREILSQSLHTGKNNMDMKDHPPGLYFVKLLSSSGQTTIKMLVNK